MATSNFYYRLSLRDDLGSCDYLEAREMLREQIELGNLDECIEVIDQDTGEKIENIYY